MKNCYLKFQYWTEVFFLVIRNYMIVKIISRSVTNTPSPKKQEY